MKDEIIDEMQNAAIVEGYAVLEDAVNRLFAAGVSESAITLSARMIYRDSIDELNDEEEN